MAWRVVDRLLSSQVTRMVIVVLIVVIFWLIVGAVLTQPGLFSSRPRWVFEDDVVAHWAMWGGIFSGLGLLVLVLTLRETLNATKIAIDTASNQIRAYVVVPFVDLKEYDRGVLLADVEFQNLGQTPTYKVALKLVVYVTTPAAKWKPIGATHTPMMEDVGALVPNASGRPLKKELGLLLGQLEEEYASATRSWQESGGDILSMPFIYFSGSVYFLDVMGTIHSESFYFSLPGSLQKSLEVYPVEYTGEPEVVNSWPV